MAALSIVSQLPPKCLSYADCFSNHILNFNNNYHNFKFHSLPCSHQFPVLSSFSMQPKSKFFSNYPSSKLPQFPIYSSQPGKFLIFDSISLTFFAYFFNFIHICEFLYLMLSCVACFFVYLTAQLVSFCFFLV